MPPKGVTNANVSLTRMAYVAGTQEPIYGPSAIKSVALEAEKTPFTELQRDDLAWRAMESTSVETQIFYVTSKSGHIAFVEIIYSNVAYECTLLPLDKELSFANYRLGKKRPPHYLPVHLQDILPRPISAPSLVLNSPQQH